MILKFWKWLTKILILLIILIMTKNEIKIGFRFIFQSRESTITDAEVNKVINSIIECALRIDSVRVPGLN